MRTVQINGKTYAVPADDSEVGVGGEGTVYRFDEVTVLKLYIQPHEIPGIDAKKRAAIERRIEEYGKKLARFPKTKLPWNVVWPSSLAYGSDGKVCGFLMPYVPDAYMLQELSRIDTARARGVSRKAATEILIRLHKLVERVHEVGVVIGDFTDKNILVKGRDPYIIDPDSMQFDEFPCRGFTARFVDPSICSSDKLVPRAPFSVLSDWYAFAVIAFQVLTQIHPFYGGVHQPGKNQRALQGAARVRKGISVFSPDVLYPPSALPLDHLPYGLRDFFFQTFEQGMRRPFPRQLLEDLKWEKCGCEPREDCRHREYATLVCPHCGSSKGATHFDSAGSFHVITNGVIQRGRIRTATATNKAIDYVVQVNDKNDRPRSGSLVMVGDVIGDTALLRLKLDHRETMDRLYTLGQDAVVIAHGHSGLLTKHTAEDKKAKVLGSFTNADANATACNGRDVFWSDGSSLQLYRYDPVHDGSPMKTLDKAPTGRVSLWAGESFGFGISDTKDQGVVPFVFTTDKGSLRYGKRLNLPKDILLLDTYCTISKGQAWLMLSVLQNNRQAHYCLVFDRSGRLVNSKAAMAGEKNWLGYGIYGACALSGKLLAPDSNGIVRVGQTSAGLMVERAYPELSEYVTSRTRIIPGKKGIYLVDDQIVWLVE